ncbi:hypothetical protein IGI04_037280 [Brassica rapa subsp. trilocularis]|uniref:FG-GAP repeat-containing protein n=1 Tax=Brassica rapa subsp. trilocularis TaxID=1813537 RepID=A0ABQ7LJJ9_BRACM|nr:hypothetical protein IGI04_037280 [Brassica rapa subsp. trilocularis]
MASGFIDRYYKDGTPKNPDLVVVTSVWFLFFFDHNLKKLWETNQQASEDSGVDNLRHFSVYLFAGRTGVLRLSKKTDDVEAHTSDAPKLIPQHNYKFECREFRELILGVMPHHWEHTPAGIDLLRKIPKLTGKAVRYDGSSTPNKGIQYILTITNYTKLWWVPTVVVAHQKKGIKAIHLSTGRILCKFHLLEGGLHADINGDGVLDHVQRTIVSGSMEVLKPRWAVATSGVPVREQLFNVSICHHTVFNSMHYREHSRNFVDTSNTSSLEISTPILIPRRGSHGDKKATWSHLPSPSGLTESGTGVPTLKPFLLRIHDNHPMILARGDQAAVILSLGGSVLASIDLPFQPTHAVIADDFSNDGLTDVIVMTSNGIYGFVQTRQPRALFLSSLVGYLLVVMTVIFIAQHLNSIEVKHRSSTSF